MEEGEPSALLMVMTIDVATVECSMLIPQKIALILYVLVFLNYVEKNSRMDLENIMLSEISQSEEDKCHMILLICEI